MRNTRVFSTILGVCFIFMVPLGIFFLVKKVMSKSTATIPYTWPVNSSVTESPQNKKSHERVVKKK